jgi:K+-transporting ATPase KdpF subunit
LNVTIDLSLAVVTALGLTAYLFYVLARPERF